MMLAGMTEWRLGAEDPSPHLRVAVADALRIPEPFVHVSHGPDLGYAMIAMFNAMYCQLLLREPVDASLRFACALPPGERREPKAFAVGWSYPWDSLVFELAERGEVSSDWEHFVAWLRGRKQSVNYVQTMTAYRDVVVSATNDDRAACEAAIHSATSLFSRRKNGDVTWGGGELGKRMVDFRLACMIQTAERIRPGITASAGTPHRWRW
jgi:hypothetical protein